MANQKRALLPPLDTGPLPLAPIRDAARKQLIDVIDSVRSDVEASQRHRSIDRSSDGDADADANTNALTLPPTPHPQPSLHSAAAARPSSWTRRCPAR